MSADGGNGVRKYRKKPVVVEAVLWTGKDGDAENGVLDAWETAAGQTLFDAGLYDEGSLAVWNTKEDCWVRCPAGHWLIRGIAGEVYPCDPDIFEATYDPA